jgi:hypothetical protein
MLKGRPLKLDVAQPPQNTRNGRRGTGQSLTRSQSDSLTGSLTDVDGRQFQGGRYTKRDSSGSSLQRQSSVNSESSEPRQRPSLKLAPRSKPREDTNETSSSSLFGEGKKRDDSDWERAREARGSDRGGRGKGRGEDKQSGRGGSNRKLGGKEEPTRTQSGKEKPKKTQFAPKKEIDATPKPPLQVQPEAAKSATTKVQNKFAALNMDSDSD